MPNIQILVVEDEPSIVELLSIGLRYEKMDVSSVDTGSKCIDRIKNSYFDLIILDIMLPDIDGMDLCSKIKLIKPNIPVIMLTAKKEIDDKIKGLNSGADDYVTKPFSFDELLARIRAVLRRYEKNKKNTEISSDGITLNVVTRSVYVKNKPVFLTPTEFAILEIFIKNPLRVFSRDALIEMALGYDYVGSANIIDVHISNLRNKIGDRPPKLIKTIYGIGYAFHPQS